MALGDEQIDRLGAIADKFVRDVSALKTEAIGEIRELLNGLSFYGGIKATEVRKPSAANPAPDDSITQPN